MLKHDISKILISGGDDRLRLNSDGVNYIHVGPSPTSDIVHRSSCTGTHISEKNFKKLERIFEDIQASKLHFSNCMENIHDRLRKIVDINKENSIITIPSGTDAEYVPLFLAAAYGKKFKYKQIINIITGIGEIGSNSATAAKGLYFSSPAPSGRTVDIGNKLPGILPVELISVSLRHSRSALFISDDRLWKKPLEKALKKIKTLILLHVVDSTKLGYRMDVIDEVSHLLRKHPEKLLVAIDSCQSRIDINRLREYLNIGCMIMITGSKFEEGPPFSGAVIIPKSITHQLKSDHFSELTPALKDYITKYDISGHMKSFFQSDFSNWMNQGLMARWLCALNNWETYQNIDEYLRIKYIHQWTNAIKSLIKNFPNIEFFSGGELQPGAEGNINTIVAIKIIKQGKPISHKLAQKIYCWLLEDITENFKMTRLTQKEREALKMRFLIGKPVDLGEFSVLRIALGAKLVCYIHQNGLSAAIKQDQKLLCKLSLIVSNFDILHMIP